MNLVVLTSSSVDSSLQPKTSTNCLSLLKKAIIYHRVCGKVVNNVKSLLFMSPKCYGRYLILCHTTFFLVSLYICMLNMIVLQHLNDPFLLFMLIYPYRCWNLGVPNYLFRIFCNSVLISVNSQTGSGEHNTSADVGSNCLCAHHETGG